MNGFYKFIFVFILIFTSCSQVKYIDIQVLKSAEITFDQPIRQLTILRMPHTVDKEVLGNDSALIQLFFNHLYDSIKAKLQESPALYDANLYISSPSEYKERFVNTDFTQRKTNYSINTQFFALDDTVFVDLDIFPGQNGEFVSEKIGVHQIRYAIIFKINNMALSEANKSISLIDTIKWEESSTDNAKKNKPLHYAELANIVASQLMEKIVPHWITLERQIYFVPNQLMRRGYKHFVANELYAAIKQWKVVYNTGTKPLASKAAFNMSLSYELLDNLKASQEWINNAIQLKNDSVFLRYQQVITKRFEERTIIDKQLWK